MPLERFGWKMDGRFTTVQVHLIEDAAEDLEMYLDDLNHGLGCEWIAEHTWGTRFHRGGLITKIAAHFTRLPTSLVFPDHDVWFWRDFDRFQHPKRHILHELGHVIENRLPRKRFLSPSIIGGGASDRLADYLGGKPSGLRFINGTCNLPRRFLWEGAGVYGNHSTADYFAEAFSWMPIDIGALPDPMVAEWFLSEILPLNQD
jgi:hypothetical protein